MANFSKRGNSRARHASAYHEQILHELRVGFHRQHGRRPTTAEWQMILGAGDPVSMDREERGGLIGLTFEAWKSIEPYHLRVVRPCDVPRKTIEEYMAARRKTRAAERARRYREKHVQCGLAAKDAADVDGRQDVIFLILGAGEMREAALVEAVRDVSAFRGLGHRSLRQIVRREVDRLAASGRVRTQLVDGRYGPVRVVLRAERQHQASR